MVRVACIFEEVDGRYYWCDNDSETLDARGRGYQTKADAMRAAVLAGYTHATGSGTYWNGEGVKKIPAKVVA